MARRRKTTSTADCAWPREVVEALRTRLDRNRQGWPAIAAATCLGERYLRAFVKRQIDCPPYDRFVLIQTALDALERVRTR